MKKIFIIALIILTLIVYNKNDSKITKDSIRFRVIANSNSTEDIIMKEKVVNKLSNIIFNESKNIEQTRKNIIDNLDNVEIEVNKLFLDNKYDKTYNILYGLNEFPEKEYNGVKYSKGLYESLVVEIGSGEGNNYWCFLYPSLCLVDYKNDNDIKYKSKIYELIKKVF